MKRTNQIFSILVTAGLLSSCLSEVEMQPQEESVGIPINLEGSVNQQVTKVNAQGFENQDELGLYAVNYENENQTPGTLLDKGNQVDHVKYIFDETQFKWTPVRKVYYKDVNTNADLYVYHPYGEPESVSKYNFEVRQDQSAAKVGGKLSGYEASDFMWGKVENVVPTEAKVKVKVDHKMSGAWVILQEGTGFAEGEFALLDKHVMAINTVRKAEINMAQGVVTPIGDAPATGIVMAPQSDGSFRAIIVPQTVANGKKWFSLTIGTKAYTYGLDQELVYQSGKMNKFTIKISKKVNTGEFEIEMADPEIVGWREDQNAINDVARQYYCVHVETPGTLGEVIKADKKNPNKIRNLKVSGKITTEDFYFMRDNMEILEAVNLKEAKVVGVHQSELTTQIRDNKGVDHNVVTRQKQENVDNVIPDMAFYNKASLFNFVFPENVTEVGTSAFCHTHLSGALVLPENLKSIQREAFSYTNINSVTFSNCLETIHENAFSHNSSLSCSLLFPESLVFIGYSAFNECSLSGTLKLPENLRYIGRSAFWYAGHFIGDLKIPDKIKNVFSQTFSTSGFSGTLNLNNVTYLEMQAFDQCDFKGDLIVPEGITIIPGSCFDANAFTSVTFPSTLKIIEGFAFKENYRLCSDLIFPENLVTIGDYAFFGCSLVPRIELPSRLQTIKEKAFMNCYGLNSIVSHASQPPVVQPQALDGIPKDNFTLEVPPQSVKRYQIDSQWRQFRRIAGHYDFSLSRDMARALNAQSTRKYVLRAPAGQKWSIESKPDWITVNPSSGNGKQNVEITFNEMTSADVTSFMRDSTDYYGHVHAVNDKGRNGVVTFNLDGKDYRTTLDVQQFDYEHQDGEVVTLQKATKGAGVNIVFMADCYDALDVSLGKYLNDIKEAYGYYFDIEPYKTYKEYFNVYAVIGVSDDSGMGSVNTVKDAKFGSQYSLNGIAPNLKTCFDYAKKADPNMDMSQTLIVMVENTEDYGGICYMWGDGSAVAICPKSRDPFPYDFRGIVQHEAGGHGFGKLADEYIYHNAFINDCKCTCCQHMLEFLQAKANGWYPNLDLTGDMQEVGWAHLIFHPKYSNDVDIFEGGFFHTRGVFRSEAVSCMNNNIPYYSAISRQAMVERIMKYAGEEFTIEKFIANDVPGIQQMKMMSAPFKETKDVNYYPSDKTHRPVYMGEHPEF